MSRLHLTAPHGQTILNAEDFYAALVEASRAYFTALATESELREAFVGRLRDPNGGMLHVATLPAR
jgi:hypothetical protein